MKFVDGLIEAEFRIKDEIYPRINRNRWEAKGLPEYKEVAEFLNQKEFIIQSENYNNRRLEGFRSCLKEWYDESKKSQAYLTFEVLSKKAGIFNPKWNKIKHYLKSDSYFKTYDNSNGDYEFGVESGIIFAYRNDDSNPSLRLLVYSLSNNKWQDIDLPASIETGVFNAWFKIPWNKKNNSVGIDGRGTWTIVDNTELEIIQNLKIKLKAYLVKREKIKKEFTDFMLDAYQRKLAQQKATDERKFETKKSLILQSFDADKNGIMDLVEGDDFLKLTKKHQKLIKENNPDQVQNFIKLSNYLKKKRKNLQSIFESIKATKDEEDLDYYVGFLNNDAHTYNQLVMHSLNLVVTLVKDDMFTFYEIYESFDKLNVFNSNWENEVSGKLSDIGDGLNQLIYSVNKMNQDIVQELSYLSYTTEASFQELQDSVSAELSSINSSIQFGNLLSGIQTYQLHKINKRGDNLLK